MIFKTVEEKLKLVMEEGSGLSQKQIGYFENFYDKIKGIDRLIYHYTPNELILFAPESTIENLRGQAGYDYSIKSSQLYIKYNDMALMLITNKNDIDFFNSIISVKNKNDIDENGNYIEEV